MSQNPIALPTSGTLSGLTAVTDINAGLLSLAQGFSGAAAPTAGGLGVSSLAGLLWHDTTNKVLWMRNQADTAWMAVANIDETNGYVAAASGLQSSGQISVTTSTSLTRAQAGGNILIQATGVTLTFPSLAATYAISNISSGNASLVYPTGSDFPTTLKPGDRVILAGDGTGYWRVVASSLAPPAAAVVRGARSNLKLSAAGGAKTCSISADAVALVDPSGASVLATSVSVTLNLSTSGAGGLDTSTVAANTWYAVYLISDAGTIKALASTGYPAPTTMPGGDTLFARVGWVLTDSASNIKAFTQNGDRTFFTNTGSGLTKFATGTAGNLTSGSYASQSWTGYAPPTVKTLLIQLVAPNNDTGLAPNNTYGPYNSGTNPPPFQITQSQTMVAELTPESSNVYWYSNGTSNGLIMAGYTDNL